MKLTLTLLLLLAACGARHATQAPTEKKEPVAKRVPALAKTDPVYPSFEGVDYKNACKVDADCFTGGCAGEVCSAQNDIVSACDIPPLKPQHASCGCVDGECIWYRTAP
jgi:eight-cysteine-cluster-containing protein